LFDDRYVVVVVLAAAVAAPCCDFFDFRPFGKPSNLYSILEPKRRFKGGAG
jgi:hypothetical protein